MNFFSFLVATFIYPAGGYLMSYENDNIKGESNVVFLTKLTRLPMIIDYPGRLKNGTIVNWISK
jgi:hypothetical protein